MAESYRVVVKFNGVLDINFSGEDQTPENIEVILRNNIKRFLLSSACETVDITDISITEQERPR